MHKYYITFSLLVLLLHLGCGPDAEHDNPLDPFNGKGVSGTVYNARGVVVPNTIITAVPANILTKTDSRGQYSLKLEGGKSYILTASNRPYYHDRIDTIAVPSNGLLVQNFILNGVPLIDEPKVTTTYTMTYYGAQTWQIAPRCIGIHQSGESLLDNWNFTVQIFDSIYIPVKWQKVTVDKRTYDWSFLWDNTSLQIIGEALTFHLDSAGTNLQMKQVVIPQRMNLPSATKPVDEYFTPPDTLYWANGASDIAVRIEIWKDTSVAWSRDLSNVSKIFCDANLESGRDYLWKVINVDLDGNRAVSEALFHVP
jgi:hypothetical protein